MVWDKQSCSWPVLETWALGICVAPEFVACLWCRQSCCVGTDQPAPVSVWTSCALYHHLNLCFHSFWCKLPISGIFASGTRRAVGFLSQKSQLWYLRCAACPPWMEPGVCCWLFPAETSGCVLKAQGTSLAYPCSLLLSEVQANPTMCFWKSNCSDSDLLFLFWGESNAVIFSWIPKQSPSGRWNTGAVNFFCLNKFFI